MTPGYLCILDICPGQDSGSRVSTKKETKTPAALLPLTGAGLCACYPLHRTPPPFLPRPTTCMIFVLPNTVRNCSKLGAAWTLDTEHWSTCRFLIVCLLLSPGPELGCGIVEWRYDGRLCSHTAQLPRHHDHLPSPAVTIMTGPGHGGYGGHADPPLSSRPHIHRVQTCLALSLCCHFLTNIKLNMEFEGLQVVLIFIEDTSCYSTFSLQHNEAPP